MSKKIKIVLGSFYVIILITFLYFLFSKFDVSRFNDFSYYKSIQTNIDNYIGTNLIFNLILFFVFAVVWIILLGFGSPLLLLSGILFGKWIGTIIATISFSVGSLSLYIIANYFFSDLVNQLLKEKFSKYIERFQKNELYYFFAFRFVGGLGMPFFMQNLLPVIFKMKNYNYFLASFFGFIPANFIWNTIGAGINEFIKKSDEFNFLNFIMSKEIFIPVLIFLLLILLSIKIKKIIFK